MSSRIKLKAKIENSRIVVEECRLKREECDELIKRPHPVYIAYYLYIGCAEVYDDKGTKLTLSELFEKFSSEKNLWIVFSVYSDLRRRGKKPEIGLDINELCLDECKTRIYVFEENTLVKVETLNELIDKNIRQNSRVIIAIVDMYGDVTYYELNRIVFQRVVRERDVV